MKTPVSTTRMNIQILGLSFAMVLCGTVLVRANSKPKIAKSNGIESSIKVSESGSFSGNNSPNQATETAGFAAEAQDMALVLENWMEVGAYWSPEEEPGIQQHALKNNVACLKSSNAGLRNSFGNEATAVFFDVQKFISDSEF